MTSRSKKTLHAAEQDRPDVAAARAELKVEQSRLDAPRLVFIDETAVTTKMVRHRGRSPRGERLVASVPHGHWKTLTLVAALRINGLTAPYVIDGAMDGPSFLAYVEQMLAPTLRKGDIVFMDILKLQKCKKSGGGNVRAPAFVIICELFDASSLGAMSIELRKLQEPIRPMRWSSTVWKSGTDARCRRRYLRRLLHYPSLIIFNRSLDRDGLFRVEISQPK